MKQLIRSRAGRRRRSTRTRAYVDPAVAAELAVIAEVRSATQV